MLNEKIIFYVAVFGMMIFVLNGVNQVNAEEVVVFDDTFENGLGEWEYFETPANPGSFFCTQFPTFSDYMPPPYSTISARVLQAPRVQRRPPNRAILALRRCKMPLWRVILRLFRRQLRKPECSASRR